MTQLTILSKEDPIPWELLFPTRGSENRGFLVEWCEVVRWQTGEGRRAPKARLPFTSNAFVLPTDAPPAAASEVAALRSLDARLADARTLTSAEDFLEAIEAANFDALHFASHNGFDGSSSAVLIGGQKLKTVLLQTAEDDRTLEARSPLVFMNACRSANQAPIYSEISGWAQSFLGAGAGAFVGSLWLVRDSSAKAFAEAFYEVLVKGGTLGSSMKAARNETKSDQGDPTWLAYTAYGDPAAVIQ
jgi:CHAT domain-containing protein